MQVFKINNLEELNILIDALEATKAGVRWRSGRNIKIVNKELITALKTSYLYVIVNGRTVSFVEGDWDKISLFEVLEINDVEKINVPFVPDIVIEIQSMQDFKEVIRLLQPLNLAVGSNAQPLSSVEWEHEDIIRMRDSMEDGDIIFLMIENGAVEFAVEEDGEDAYFRKFPVSVEYFKENILPQLIL